MKKEILVVGIYLADQKNNTKGIIDSFSESSEYIVTQKWVSIGKNPIEKELRPYTTLEIKEKTPKFKILNKVISEVDLNRYDFIIISDDDVTLPDNFVDNYLKIVTKYDFTLAQPARTHNSYIDHFIVEQFDGLVARKTRFVEIGPVFSIRRDSYNSLLPFDEKSGMGWGCDFVWPCIIDNMGKNMGIVDAFPVEHSMRAPVVNYSHKSAEDDMIAYLKTKQHLSHEEAFKILESYV